MGHRKKTDAEKQIDREVVAEAAGAFIEAALMYGTEGATEEVVRALELARRVREEHRREVVAAHAKDFIYVCDMLNNDEAD